MFVNPSAAAAPADAGTPVVSIVDDDACARRSMARLIHAAGWAVESFSSATDFMERRPDPDAACVLLDVQMPGLSGMQLHAWMNEAGILLPVVFLTRHGDILTSVAAMKKGAVDFLLKPVEAEDLLRAVRQAIDLHARSRREEEIRERQTCLTPREREVMEQVIAGRLNKQIAADLRISEKTVKAHRGRAMEKMGVRTVAALVHAWYAAGSPQAGRHTP